MSRVLVDPIVSAAKIELVCRGVQRQERVAELMKLLDLLRGQCKRFGGNAMDARRIDVLAWYAPKSRRPDALQHQPAHILLDHTTARPLNHCGNPSPNKLNLLIHTRHRAPRKHQPGGRKLSLAQPAPKVNSENGACPSSGNLSPPNSSEKMSPPPCLPAGLGDMIYA